MALTENRIGGVDTEPAGTTPMRVRKRNGDLEPVDVNKIVKAVERCALSLPGVDPMRVATRTISGLCDGATTEELDELSIRTSAALIIEEPNYSRLAARLLATVIDKEVRNQGIHSFSQSVGMGLEQGIIGAEVAEFVATNARKLNDTVVYDRDNLFEFFGLRTVYDRYLLRHPENRMVTETPQYFFLRVACGLSTCPDEAIRFYRLISSLQYLPSSPTLFNSGTVHPQMSSCYLLDSPEDSLEGIYKRYTDIAKLSKFAGGIGVAWHRIRSKGSLIRGTNGLSNGIIPWLKTLDSSVAAVNQGGRRKGAACVYLETWHADIDNFLDLRENTGDPTRRTHNLNLANWIPDLFMERVEKDWQWSLFDPHKVPHLTDLFGAEFEAAYQKAEEEGIYERQVPARELYSRMMRSLAQTGNGWMTFKDASNRKCNQTGTEGRVVHLSNLCTEILEVTDQSETAVCNLGSVNLAAHIDANGLNMEKLERTISTAMRMLDNVIDYNYYSVPQARRSNLAHRPVGLGLMGFQDALYKQSLAYASEEAIEFADRSMEAISYFTIKASSNLAEERGRYASFNGSLWSQGILPIDSISLLEEGRGNYTQIDASQTLDWDSLRERVKTVGMRNSNTMAIAPTATISNICGVCQSIEPTYQNLFVKSNLSGEFTVVNPYMVRELKTRGLWDDVMVNDLKYYDGSVQPIDRIPEELKNQYATAFEIDSRWLIEAASRRQKWIDQGQSLNLYMPEPSGKKLDNLYKLAWVRGLKTTYYLRSLGATHLEKTTKDATQGDASSEVNPYDNTNPGSAAPKACSILEPDCEACQ